MNAGQMPLDFNYNTFIVDPENRLYGSLNYHIVKSNVGADNSYYISEGSKNMRVAPSF